MPSYIELNSQFYIERSSSSVLYIVKITQEVY